MLLVLAAFALWMAIAVIITTAWCLAEKKWLAAVAIALVAAVAFYEGLPLLVILWAAGHSIW